MVQGHFRSLLARSIRNQREAFGTILSRTILFAKLRDSVKSCTMALPALHSRQCRNLLALVAPWPDLTEMGERRIKVRQALGGGPYGGDRPQA